MRLLVGRLSRVTGGGALGAHALDQYWRRSGNRKFLAEFWSSAQKAHACCLSTLDSDGLMDNTKAGRVADDVRA